MDASCFTLCENDKSSDDPEGQCFSACRKMRFFEDNQRRAPESQSVVAVEAAISEDLYQLTMKERQDVLHDIHGVSDLFPETPEIVQAAKEALELNILTIMQQQPQSPLAMAWHQNSNYVQSLYHKFLRSDGFIIEDTAIRMRKHFESKLRLFGPHTLGRDITLSQDFNKEDMRSLKAGFFQILPERDRSGRAILVKTWSEQTYQCRENVWRVLWYLNMQASRDEETQKKGMVAVIYCVGDTWMRKFDKDLFQGVGEIKEGLPTRDEAVHYCYSDPAFGAIIACITMLFHRRTRSRTRLHQGSHVEVHYEVLPFGIPAKGLCVNSEGTFRNKEHIAFIKCRQKEEHNFVNDLSASPAIIVPSNSDVLFGRGKVMQQRPGNMKLSLIVEEHLEDYFQGTVSTKTNLRSLVVNKIKQEGGWFLRQDTDGLWIPVDEETALDKVSHAFRNRKSSGPSAKEKTTDRKRIATTNNGSQEPNKRIVATGYDQARSIGKQAFIEGRRE